MSAIEVFLDDTPGETRGIVARDGRFERLIVQRDSDIAQHRLGARSVGRVIEPDAAFRAAFIDLGCDGPAGFLPLSKSETLRVGEALEVEVTAEPRERKGPVLRRVGPGQGRPRLLKAGPSVIELLAALVPGIAPGMGVEAIQASWDAEEEALGQGDFFAKWALDLAVQRTRALIAVDIDYVHLPGEDARKGRARANRLGLAQAARMIRLKSWGGLVAVDLVGTSLDPAEVTRIAEAAFAGDGAGFGPLSRFGLLQLTLPWRRRPIEEVLNDAFSRRSDQTRAIDVVRHLRHGLLSDTQLPRLIARCAPQEAEMAAPLVTRLGPRAGVRADPTLAPGRFILEEG